MPRVLPGEWFTNLMKRRFEWYPQIVDDGAVREPTISVPIDEAQALVEFMIKEGHVKPRLFDNGVRQDDLKLMNRLIDVIEQKVPGGNKE